VQKIFHLFAVVLSICFFAEFSFGQFVSKERQAMSLCSLQQSVTQGNHETVRVSGIYGPGLDHTILEDPACSANPTWVELDLRSKRNEEKLRRLLNHSRQAYVVLEGEFYGPPVPDPKLPEAIRKSYYPGWGHLAAFKTKLVIHAIQDVQGLPSGRMTPPPPNEYPQLTHADMPLYPQRARTAHISGTVEILVTVERGAVVETEVKSSSSPHLTSPTIANIKTWQFKSEDRISFLVEYVYEIKGKQTPVPENPRLELDLPRLVKIIARPFKPTQSEHRH
jgi:TonB-like protein